MDTIKAEVPVRYKVDTNSSRTATINHARTFIEAIFFGGSEAHTEDGDLFIRGSVIEVGLQPWMRKARPQGDNFSVDNLNMARRNPGYQDSSIFGPVDPETLPKDCKIRYYYADLDEHRNGPDRFEIGLVNETITPEGKIAKDPVMDSETIDQIKFYDDQQHVFRFETVAGHPERRYIVFATK